MLKDFVSNATLLIAAFTVMGQIFKNKPLHPTSKNRIKIYWGICYGLLGIVLMLFSFQINSTTIADLRHLAIVIAAAFGGYIPALIASGIIAIGRICIFGFNDTALLASINALLTGIVCGWFSKLNYHPTLKAFYMNLIGLFFISIVFTIYIEDNTMLTNVLMSHYLISLVGGFFAYHLSVYIANTNATEQKLHKANELLNRLSFMDGLTGIGNRRHFDDTLYKEWSSLTSVSSPLTLLMFDIDYFKKYNDTYGHLAGDHCLQTIAESIEKLVSNKSNYTFCRYGGEEFAIILSFTELNRGIQLAKAIQQQLKELSIEHKSSDISTIVTLSIGLATVIPSTENSPKELIHLADTALYTSKTKGRNTISTS